MPKLSPVIRNKVYAHLLTAGLSAGAALGGAVLIAPNEGLVLGTYVDPVGIVTSCYGHVDPTLKLGMKFTQEECDRQLAKDVEHHHELLMKVVKVPLNQYQEASLTSFTYNVGIGNVKSSSLIKLLNQGKYESACRELTKWSYAGGKWYEGLFKRRSQEMKMCLGQVDIATELSK